MRPTIHLTNLPSILTVTSTQQFNIHQNFRQLIPAETQAALKLQGEISQYMQQLSQLFTNQAFIDLLSAATFSNIKTAQTLLALNNLQGLGLTAPPNYLALYIHRYQQPGITFILDILPISFRCSFEFDSYAQNAWASQFVQYVQLFAQMVTSFGFASAFQVAWDDMQRMTDYDSAVQSILSADNLQAYGVPVSGSLSANAQAIDTFFGISFPQYDNSQVAVGQTWVGITTSLCYTCK